MRRIYPKFWIMITSEEEWREKWYRRRKKETGSLMLIVYFKTKFFKKYGKMLTLIISEGCVCGC